MAEDMALLNARLSGAQEDGSRPPQAVAKLEAELAELKEKPVEVAVETVVDPEAIEKARAEAVAGMQEKLDKAREAQKAGRGQAENRRGGPGAGPAPAGGAGQRGEKGRPGGGQGSGPV